MSIGVIGAGNIGGELARKFRSLGHEVRISNSRGPKSLGDFAEETGAIASSTQDVILNSDVIFIAITQGAITSLPKELFASLQSEVIVVDTGNYYHFRDGANEDIDGGLADSEWVVQQLGRPVLKAFNNIAVSSLKKNAQPVGHPERFALPVSGDNGEQKKEVLIALIESIGFDALDAGLLSQSWRQQPGSPAYCTDYPLTDLPNILQSAVRDELKTRTDVFVSRVFGAPQPNLALLEDVQWRRDQAAEPYESILQDYNRKV